jgi:hypothetical protein
MALGVSIRAESVRSLAFGSISGTYAAIGTAFANPITLMFIVNNTDALLTFTYDKLDASGKWVVPALSTMSIDIGANRTAHANTQSFPINTVIYVKGAPTVGTVYISTFYPTG